MKNKNLQKNEVFHKNNLELKIIRQGTGFKTKCPKNYQK